MAKFSIGVDLGGTNLRVGAFTAEFERLGFLAMPTRVSAGPEEVLRDLCNGVRKLLGEFSGYGELQGVGVGAPGPLELPAGRLTEPPNLPGFEGFELKRTLEHMLQLPVHVECDANAAALAECWRGAGKDAPDKSLCMLTLGTGVGNGIVLHGKIWHGSYGMAGEAGHTSIFPDGPVCCCGSRGCLELYASATGIRRIAAEISANGSAPVIARTLQGDAAGTTSAIARVAETGDPHARELFRQAGRALGLGLAGLVNSLNLPLYVIGGGVASAWPLFAPTMFETVTEFSYVYRLTRPLDSASTEKNKTRVVPAVLGPDAGLMGAAMLPSQMETIQSVT